ncbi:MAG: putative oxidoreductase YdhV [Candidatus Izimaplasma bacterium HR2]|nr:MAG: putative oxidoreductase YdhV [Candidatus Izimaplasma bacterium HR2]
MFGYMGKLLRINLTNNSIKVEDLDLELAKKFVGGRGLGTKMLYDEIDPKIDALSPENKLFFINGPMSGTPTPTGGRYMVVTKSPLSGTIASSNSGGTWGARLKYAGYDGIIVEGKADKPVYITVTEENVEINDAFDLWGKTVGETTDILQKEKKTNVLAIGPAGERLSKIAAIMNDKDRAAGRSGVGAVMGSKNLKAIVVTGNLKVSLFDEEATKANNKEATQKLKDNPVTGEGLPAYGTAVLVNVINANGMFPTNNFQEGVFDNAEEISGETLAEKYLVRKDPCHRCPIGCGRYTKTDKVEGGGPEYETIWAFGADCGVKDLAKIIEANYWCNQYGIDTISAGATLAAAMELSQIGLLDHVDFEGHKLEFGNDDAIVYWTKKLALREGFGDEMADGSYRLCEKYGRADLSMSVKKLEIPAYDPRGVQGHGLNYATSNRGGCHVRGYMISPEILGLPAKLERQELKDKPFWTKTFQDLTAFIDSTGLCLFTSFALGADDYAKIFNSIVGTNWNGDDVLKAGERIYNIEKQFNIEAGILPEEDTLPERFLKVPMPAGPTEGHVHRLSELLPEYYELRGWDSKGAPTKERLEDLGL